MAVNSAFDQAAILRDLPPHLVQPAAGTAKQLIAIVKNCSCETAVISVKRTPHLAQPAAGTVK